MNERAIIAKFNSFLIAGFGIQDAERLSSVDLLQGEVRLHFNFFRKLAIDCGASPVLAMGRLAQLVQNKLEVDSRVRLAMAGPKATARMVYWLPMAALLLGQLAGLGSIEVFFHQPISWVSLAIGSGLLIIGNLWTGRMLSKIETVEAKYFALDAIAICMSAGLSIDSARAEVARASAEIYEHELPEAVTAEIDSLQNLSESTGVAVAKLLQSRADEIRGEQNYKKLEAIERLAVKLLWPLGVFVLPAFALIAVFPMSLAMITKGST